MSLIQWLYSQQISKFLVSILPEKGFLWRFSDMIQAMIYQPSANHIEWYGTTSCWIAKVHKLCKLLRHSSDILLFTMLINELFLLYYNDSDRMEFLTDEKSKILYNTRHHLNWLQDHIQCDKFAGQLLFSWMYGWP